MLARILIHLTVIWQLQLLLTKPLTSQVIQFLKQKITFQELDIKIDLNS